MVVLTEAVGCILAGGREGKMEILVYYSLGFSLGSYEQSLARVHRPGQTRPVEYIHLLAEGR